MLNEINWYLDKYAPADAHNKNHPLCEEMYSEMKKDFDNHLESLKDAVSGLSQENKF